MKPEEEGGIISRVIKDLFSEVERAKLAPPVRGVTTSAATSSAAETIEFTVSFVEIYMEQIRDLLAASGGSLAPAAISGGLKIRENAQKGIYIEDMTQVQTQTEHATMELVKAGILNRAVSSTRMNKDSSRSHSILIISCTRKTLKSTVLKRSSMYIVDLAGSEFVNKTNAAGKVLQEAKAINKSLSALSNVIKALVEGKKHVPYRDSKLTRILQDSLGGSAKTCLILAASCSSYNMSETISTLRFGLRAKEIKNPVVQKQESVLGIGPGGIFKELYQQAMEEIEEKNRKIDELQRLLTAVYQENQQLTENEQLQVSPEQQGEQNDEGWLAAVDENLGSGDDEVTRKLSAEVEAEASKAQGEEDANLGSSSSDGEASDEDEELEAAIREKEELTQCNMALLDENKRLFHVLEALESQLDQVVVDFSTGKPILSLSSRTKEDAQSSQASQQELSAAARAEQEQHLLSLKIWLQSDKWQQSLESRPETELIEPVDEAKACSEPSPSPRRSTDHHVLSTTSGEQFDQRLTEISASLGTTSSGSSDSGSPLLRPCASNTDTTPCVHRIDAEALSRQIVELKLQLHYLSEATKQAMDGESYLIVIENARLKTRIEELEFQANLCTVACNQLEMKNRACETRLSNQETHIGCLQNSLQEYQGLFKQQIIMSQEKCRLLTDELEFYKKLAKCSQQSSQHLSGSGTTTPLSLSPLKSSPSPRKHRNNTSSSAFSCLSSSSAGAAKISSGSTTTAIGAVVVPVYPEPNQQDSSAGGNPFGLWRGFGSLYKPSKTLPSGEVEIELAERSIGSSSLSSAVSPLSVKMSRPIVKPISSTSSSSNISIGPVVSTTEQTGGESSFSPWIVKGFEGSATSGTRSLLTSRASHLSSSSSREQDATLDELAAPIEMHGH